MYTGQKNFQKTYRKKKKNIKNKQTNKQTKKNTVSEKEREIRHKATIDGKSRNAKDVEKT